MSLSTPDMPKPPPTPARRPERGETISPEDIAVGTEDESSDERRGRRALRRPAGNVQGNDMSVGTGLSA